jgi:outer membrane protein TolC
MSRPALRATLSALLLAVVAGCASIEPSKVLTQTQQELAHFGPTPLELALTPAQVAQRRAAAQRLLEQPLQQADAVGLSLLNNPALQALLARAMADAAQAAQQGHIANPRLGLEWSSLLDETEIARRISFGLLDLLTLPQRQGLAAGAVQQVQLQLSMDVVVQISAVRQAWVKAVAAQEATAYAQQVQEAAGIGAQLARRMQNVGNISKLQAARQQLWYTQATVQLAQARDEAQSAREGLVRALGLDSVQAQALRLAARLPDVPAAPREFDAAMAQAWQTRLDLRMAQAAWESAQQARALGLWTSRGDVEIGLRNDLVRGAEGSNTRQGLELGLALPLFDDGSLRRSGLDARSLALALQVQSTERQAASQLRESYAHYRSTYELARQYRDELLPLRKTMSEETLLRYNGMLVSVFDLLVDAQEQITLVRAALAAQQQFWLADAALQAALVGKPLASAPGIGQPFSQGTSDAAH